MGKEDVKKRRTKSFDEMRRRCESDYLPKCYFYNPSSK